MDNLHKYNQQVSYKNEKQKKISFTLDFKNKQLLLNAHSLMPELNKPTFKRKKWAAEEPGSAWSLWQRDDNSRKKHLNWQEAIITTQSFYINKPYESDTKTYWKKW